MKRIFPKLGPHAVEMRSRGGAVFFVRMLPVRMWDHFTAITGTGAETLTAEDRALGRARIRAILETVWPREHASELMRLDYVDCIEVANTLFFGEDRPKEEAQAKKALKKRPDLEFLAAQMLAVYPGYTLDSLLDLPIPVFFRLQELAPRVRVDDALERLLPAVAAALSGGKIMQEMNTIRGELTLPDSPATPQEAAPDLSAEQAADLDAQLDQILAGNYTVIDEFKPGLVK